MNTLIIKQRTTIVVSSNNLDSFVGSWYQLYPDTAYKDGRPEGFHLFTSVFRTTSKIPEEVDAISIANKQSRIGISLGTSCTQFT